MSTSPRKRIPYGTWRRIRDFRYPPAEFFRDYEGLAELARQDVQPPPVSIPLPHGGSKETDADLVAPQGARVLWLAQHYTDAQAIAVRLLVIDLIDGALATFWKEIQAAGSIAHTRDDGRYSLDPAFIERLLIVTRRTDGHGCWLDEEEIRELIAEFAGSEAP